jgi:hypothetical protein
VTYDFKVYTKHALSVLEKKILQIVDPAKLPDEEALNMAIDKTRSEYDEDIKLMKVPFLSFFLSFFSFLFFSFLFFSFLSIKNHQHRCGGVHEEYWPMLLKVSFWLID